MEDTNRGIITAIIVIVIIIAAIVVWPRIGVAYTYRTTPVVQRYVPTTYTSDRTVVTQPTTVIRTVPHTTTSTTTHVYQYQPPATTTTYYQEGGVCTMDAQQCPDGSYVGRMAPSCEFAPCPN